jgi:hypothetical protein
MRPTSALVLVTFGTLVASSACRDTLDPSSAAGAGAASLEVAQRVNAGGVVAGMRGEPVFRPEVDGLRALSSAAASATTSLRSVVLPNAYADVMGEANNVYPFNFSDARYQQIFLGSELGGLRSLSGLCLRGDEVYGWGPASTMELTVKLGPTQRDPSTLGTVFDANYSGAPTTVFSGVATFPASPGVGTTTSFDMCIEFTNRYVHSAGSNLIVEIVMTTSSGGRTPDACFFSAGCTSQRVYAFDATATTGTREPTALFGLIMKFISTDAATKDDCKNGGWESYGFPNQGQCIRFIQTGKDSR